MTSYTEEQFVVNTYAFTQFHGGRQISSSLTIVLVYLAFWTIGLQHITFTLRYDTLEQNK